MPVQAEGPCKDHMHALIVACTGIQDISSGVETCLWNIVDLACSTHAAYIKVLSRMVM